MSATDGDGRLPRLDDVAFSEIDEAVATVFETIGRPVKSAALFYSLLYLVDIEGVAAASFDFKQVRERQSAGMYWYGNYSMAAEFGHAANRYFIAGTAVDRQDGAALRDHAEGFLFPDDPEMAEAAWNLLVQAGAIAERASPRNRVAVQDTLERVKGILIGTDVRAPWPEIARDLYAAMPNGGTSPSLMRQDDRTGWAVGFDGPAWVGIGDHLLRRDEFSDTAWVDQSWSIEHNNSNWFDKVNFEVTDAEEAAVQTIIFDGMDASASQADMIRGTRDILDVARDGPTSRLFDYAEFFESQVGVDIRRQRQLLGI